jgi:hypothetical protein
MESVVRAAEIAKTLPKQSAHHVQSLLLVAHMPLQFKNLMEFGADFQKMID